MIRALDQMDVAGKKLLVRVDFNVPLKDGKITDDNRIRASLPTIEYGLKNGAALILCSHLGKPKTGPDPKLSLAPCAARLSELIGRPVRMAPAVVGPEVEKLAAALKPGEILMLENLRFEAGETKGDEALGRALAALGDIYVGDAFGTAHRAHASIVAAARAAKARCAGMLLIKEWQYLGEKLADPARPFAAISGGAKVSSKLGILNNLLDKVDILVVVGAMANTFLLAQGRGVGTSLAEPELVEEAKKVMAAAKTKNVNLVLPVDFVLGSSLEGGAEGVVAADAIPGDKMVLDVGPRSLEAFAAALAPAKTVVWNGPAGAFENPAFAAGSVGLAKVVAGLDAVTIAGGGDTGAQLAAAGMADKVSFISTGGGAFLELLEGKDMPGFTALKD
ncbi:MAG: phosphoglycerate kinase [Thermodesulfobacteriota bacterium]